MIDAMRLFAVFLSVILTTVGVSAEGWDNARPSWMPDGKIVFSSNRTGNWDLFVMDNDGSNQKNLTNTDSDEHFPSVSPDGREIAFVMQVDDNYDIYVLNISTGDTRRLTSHEDLDDWPSWYEDGEKIVFDSNRSGTWAIYMMNADGSDKELLVDHAGRDVDPDASPDSPWIVFSSERPNGSQVFAFDPKGDIEIQLTDDTLSNGAPSISRDGKSVIINVGVDNGTLHLKSIDGASEDVLTSRDFDDRWSQWSPDGSAIAFDSKREGRWDIFVLDLATSDTRRLTYGGDGKP